MLFLFYFLNISFISFSFHSISHISHLFSGTFREKGRRHLLLADTAAADAAEVLGLGRGADAGLLHRGEGKGLLKVHARRVVLGVAGVPAEGTGNLPRGG